MCGILGVVSSPLPESKILKGALDSIRHRGPDDEGYLFACGFDGCLTGAGPDTHSGLKDRWCSIDDIDASSFQLLLAHRRLAILDLSQAGHQPFNNTAGNLWITYNGEVFNYKELRFELKSKGYHFRSDTDTEVVLAAYDAWGDRFPERLNGQWAFCIYDKNRGRLFCSRDRFGIKPFYYWHDEARFVFASEIKALFNLPFVSKTIDHGQLSEFVFNYRIEHMAESLYKGIYQLLPGHNLTFDLTTRRLRTTRYYQLPFNPETGRYSHEKALKYADDIRNLFIDSVRMQLVSDVPVGSCLSGGLDSSFIVAAINRLFHDGKVAKDAIWDKQKTFTASFDDPAADETVYAKAVIRHTGVNGFFCRPGAETLWKEIHQFLSYHDGICFGTNVYAGWEVMRLAARHVKVLLNGQGGDEVFGGYPRYDGIQIASLIRQLKMKETLALLSNEIRLFGFNYGFNQFKRGIKAFFPEKLRQYFSRKRYATQLDLLHHLFGNPYFPRAISMVDNDPRMTLNEKLWMDQTQTYLPMLLRYDDRNASAVSIENRVPFLDHRLVEYVNAIPSVYKIHKGWRKWLLRLSMRDMLPEHIIWRKEKAGFSTPSEKWLLSSISPVPALMRRHGIETFSHQLWCVLVAEKLLGEVN